MTDGGRPNVGKLTNIAGMQFGWLLVTSRAESESYHRLSNWNVICKCGCRFVVRSDALRNGTKTSCGDCRHECYHHIVLQTIYDGTSNTRFGM
jgi:hypothetical protein